MLVDFSFDLLIETRILIRFSNRLYWIGLKCQSVGGLPDLGFGPDSIILSVKFYLLLWHAGTHFLF